MTSRKLRLGLVGLGPWGRNVLRVLRQVEGAELVGVCDRDAERLRGLEPSLFTTADFDELLGQGELDALFVTTPPASHAELALAALGRGLHVFVEKPLALCWSDAVAVDRARQRAGRLLMVGHILLFHPAVVALRRLFGAGELGGLRRLATTRLGSQTRHGSAWWTLGPHDLSLALAFARRWPRRISLRRAGPGDRLAAWLDFGGGMTAELEVGSQASPKVRRVECFATGGRALLSDQGQAELTIEPSGRAPRVCRFDGPEPLLVEAEAFVRAALSGAPVASGAELGVGVTRLLLAGEESLGRGGRPIELAAGSAAAQAMRPVSGLEALA